MRAFIALELGPEVRDRLGDLIRTLGAGRRGVKWSRPEQVHLTLKFFGEVPEEGLPPVISAVAAAVAETAPFPILVRGAGSFGAGGRIRVVWAGIEEPSGALARLQASVEVSVALLGFPREERPFHPHLTLGRFRVPAKDPPLAESLARQSQFDGGRFTVDRVILFSSTLTPAGPIYRAAHTWPLEARP
jgi:RNA 2',3'-cyclic 3'-phosphodiesterase